MNFFKSFVKEEDGQALAEYGLIIALIAVVAIAVLSAFGGAISDKICQLSNTIKNGKDDAAAEKCVPK